MKYPVVMQGHLAGFQDDVDSIGLIDFDRNLLAAREHRPSFQVSSCSTTSRVCVPGAIFMAPLTAVAGERRSRL